MSLPAAETHIAAASNFAGAIEALVKQFEAQSDHTVTVSLGSTGKLYAQIKNGAPFDVFFAADADRPERLEREGAAIPGTRFTYAIGRLVLWSAREGFVDSEGEVLRSGGFRHLAIANPRLAPYGRAAQETLEELGVWETVASRLVRGENIGQVFQFVATGNAELGFVALAQLVASEFADDGSRWVVPTTKHAPIEQQAILLQENEGARAFLGFVRSDEGRQIVRESGYDLP